MKGAADRGAATHGEIADARQGRTTIAMPKHRRGVLTLYSAASSPCPAGYGGTGPTGALGLLDVAQGYAFEAPPSIWPRGARNVARPPIRSTLRKTSAYENVQREDL
jgi:hypothetical protein